MKLCIKKKNIYLFAGLFMLLLISFNISLNSTIFGIAGIYVCMFASVICILLYQYNHGGLSLTAIRINRSSVATWSMLLLPILLNNQDVARGRIVYLLYYLVIIIWGFLLAEKYGWEQQAWIVIRAFCTMHFVMGLFLLANRNILLNNIVPLFQIDGGTYMNLMNAISNGYMTGLCYHYSTMGMYMSIGAIFFSGVLFQTKRVKLRDILILIAFLVGLVMTGKRGPLIFTILALGITILVTTRQRITRKQMQSGVIIGVILIIAFIIAYINVPQLKQVIGRFTMDSGDLNDFSSGRIDYFWISAIGMFLDNPIFGHGWRSFKYYGVGTLSANDAHNIYLQLLAEVGIIGFALVMFFMIRALVTTYKAIRKNEVERCLSNENACILKMSFAYQIFFLLYGLTGNPLYDPQCYFPYIICCAIGYSTMNRILDNNAMQR